MNKCAICGKDVKEEHTLFKKSKIFKGGICPDCYLTGGIDRELPPPSWKEKNGIFYY